MACNLTCIGSNFRIHNSPPKVRSAKRRGLNSFFSDWECIIGIYLILIIFSHPPFTHAGAMPGYGRAIDDDAKLVLKT